MMGFRTKQARRRAALAGVLVVSTLVAAPAWAQTTAEDLIRQAGNAETDEARLAILHKLRDREDIDDALRVDAERLIEHVDKWLNNPRLEYFGNEVLKTGTYDFGVGKQSPLYPVARLHEARMLVWVTLEYGGLWSHPDRRREQFDKIRPMFDELHATFPENRVIGMYLGKPVPPEKEYKQVEGAPAWAVHQREGLERLADIVEWWIDHRMQESGEYGGGWGDDCEMWRWWAPVLAGFDDDKIVGAQARFSKALLSQDHMKDGYTSRLHDVEHTAEDSSDALTPMMLIEPEAQEWRQRAMRLAELMEELWTGENERGQLQFKSTYFSATKVDDSAKRACDTVYHPRAVEPALILWQRTGDAKLDRLFTAWMNTWVDAAARAERGKPAGIIPSAIHWPDGGIGGVGAAWWKPENHTDDPLYVWPSAMSLMTNSLLLTYHMTGETRYLEPLRSMAAARLDYLEQPPSGPVEAGSRAWCASKLGGLSQVLGKYRLLTGDPSFDPLLQRDAAPYLRFRLWHDEARLVSALASTAQALRTNFPGYTSEVRYTDRVLRFPAMFGRNGMYPDALEGFPSPGTGLLYATVTGDPGSPNAAPMNAVRWITRPRDFAALVSDAGADRFTAHVFHFGTSPRKMAADLYLLKPGEYTLEVRAEDEEAVETAFSVTGPRTRVPLTIPPARTCELIVRTSKAGVGRGS